MNFIMFVYTNSVKLNCETTTAAYVNQARIRSWNQPVLSYEGNIFRSRKQREPLIGLELKAENTIPIIM